MKIFRKLTKSEFKGTKGQFSVGLVVGDVLAGFVIYKKTRSRIIILKISNIIGNRSTTEDLINKVAEIGGELNKVGIEYVVPEKELEILMILKESGFKAVEIMPDFYENEGLDGFKMVFSIENDEKVLAKA